MKLTSGMITGLALGLALVATGCGKGGTASATLQFKNSTLGVSSLAYQRANLQGQLLTQPDKPSVFQMKMIAAYLAVDIDPISQNNVGITSMFYLNPDCKEDIMHCDISTGTAEDGKPMDKVVTSFFDFNQSSTAVNAALNAQARDIQPATYKYVRIEFCKYNSQNSANIKWAYAASDNGTEHPFRRNSCTVNSAVLNPPIVVAKGDNVMVSVAYDVSGAVVTDPGMSGGGDDHAGGFAFSLPQFVPSASK